MAIGLTPKHLRNFHLNELSREEFLALSYEAAGKLEWEVGYLSENGLIAYTDNGMFSRNFEIKIHVENNNAGIQSSSVGSEMMDFGRNRKNVNEFISVLEELKSSLTKEDLENRYVELKEKMVSSEEDVLQLPPATTYGQIRDFFSIFKPVKGFFVTPVLLNLNIIIFILMSITGVNILLPDNESLINWGANFRPMTLDGQGWRLITNCFLHIGIFHLLLNMYALLYIGVLLEPLLGKTRFIAAYLLSGITASVASLWWHDLTISAGASGAIFGMYGVFLALLTTNLIEKTARKTLLTSIAVFVGYNLVNGLKGGIDNAAHIGGLIGGLIIGYAFIPSLKKPEERRLKLGTTGLLSILILGSSFAVYKNIPNYMAAYEAKMEQFSSMESMALEVYSMSQTKSKEKILYEIKDIGIYNWNESIKLLNSLDDMDLPGQIIRRNKILKEYCELRIKCYELLYRSIAEETNEYDEAIENYNKQIEAKITELNGEQEKK